MDGVRDIAMDKSTLRKVSLTRDAVRKVYEEKISPLETGLRGVLVVNGNNNYPESKSTFRRILSHLIKI